MAIALIGPRDVRLSADTGSALIAREQDMGRWKLQAQLALAGTGAYELNLRFVAEGGAPASTLASLPVRLSSLATDMGATSLPLSPVSIRHIRPDRTLRMAARRRSPFQVAR